MPDAEPDEAGELCAEERDDRPGEEVLWGDLEPKLAQNIDPGRLSKASIGLDAIANRRTAEETLTFYGEDAEARFMKGE